MAEESVLNRGAILEIDNGVERIDASVINLMTTRKATGWGTALWVHGDSVADLSRFESGRCATQKNKLNIAVSRRT